MRDVGTGALEEATRPRDDVADADDDGRTGAPLEVGRDERERGSSGYAFCATPKALLASATFSAGSQAQGTLQHEADR